MLQWPKTGVTPVRFGKRNKQSLAMGWRVRTQPDDSEFSPVASEERNALLSPAEADDEGNPISDDPPATGTQRLLTALGRFERQVTKAREGAPQEVWSDECMNQLISAVEVALSEGWEEVVEALTETGRILQSYENVNQAHQAIPFLSDSYEALCLMVGDLIVGKVRSGVILKWRNRYRLALDDLKEAGIPLVRDDDEPSRRRRGVFLREEASESEPRTLTFPTPAARVEPEPVDAPEEDYPSDEAERDAETVAAAAMPEEAKAVEPPEPTTGYEAPRALDELPPLTPLRMDLFEMDARRDEAAAEEADSEDGNGTAPEVIERLDILCEQLSGMERNPEADPLPAFCTILDSVSYLEQDALNHERPGRVSLCTMMARMCDRASELEGGPDDKFFELAYAFCGVYVEADDGPDNPMIRSWIEECEGLLTYWSEAPAEAVEEAPEEPSDSVFEDDDVSPAFEALEAEEQEEADAEPLVLPVELVANAEEAEVESPETFDEAEEIAPEPQVEVPVADAEEPVSDREETVVTAESVPLEVLETEQAIPEETEEAAAPLTDDEAAESPESLLEVAQRAMTGGRAADAKRLALRAAAMLAELEVEQAVKRVAEAEMRLRQGADLIEQARSEVQQAEQTVVGASKSVEDGEVSLELHRSQTGEVGQQLTEVEQRVADLDEQIRQLQLRREEEARKLEATRQTLEEARQAEEAAAAELAALKQAEEEARVRLEDSRQRVKILQRKRTEVEAAMERAREALTQQRLSLADIKETLAQVGERSPGDEAVETEELLF